jgi:hypothetical protein
MSLLGNLSEVSLPDLLLQLEREQRSGMLSIWSPIGIYRIWFYEGRLIGAVSPDKKYALLQLLIDAGSIDSGLANSFTQEFQEPLGNHLRKYGLINPPDLAKAFRRQLAVGLYGIFSLDVAQFKFSDNVPMPYGELTGLSKGSMEAALEGLRQIDILSSAPQALPSPDSVYKPASKELPPLQFSSLEWKIWEQLSAAATLGQLAERVKVEFGEVGKIVARLARLGLVVETSLQRSVALAGVGESHGHGVTAAVVASANRSSASTVTPVNATLLKRFKSFLNGVR